jgi:hypothetical protein
MEKRVERRAKRRKSAKGRFRGLFMNLKLLWSVPSGVELSLTGLILKSQSMLKNKMRI